MPSWTPGLDIFHSFGLKCFIFCKWYNMFGFKFQFPYYKWRKEVYLLANTQLRSSSTLLSVCCSSLRIPAASSSSCKIKRIWVSSTEIIAQQCIPPPILLQIHFHFNFISSFFLLKYSWILSTLKKRFRPMLHQKEALICWILKFILSCTIMNGKLHQKLITSSNKITKL